MERDNHVNYQRARNTFFRKTLLNKTDGLEREIRRGKQVTLDIVDQISFSGIDEYIPVGSLPAEGIVAYMTADNSIGPKIALIRNGRIIRESFAIYHADNDEIEIIEERHDIPGQEVIGQIRMPDKRSYVTPTTFLKPIGLSTLVMQYIES